MIFIFYLQKGSITSVLKGVKTNSIKMQRFSVFDSSEFFKFPTSKNYLEYFGSVAQIRQAFNKLFQKLYGQNKEIKCFLVSVNSETSTNPLARRLSISMKRKVKGLLIIRCMVCTNKTVYGHLQGTLGYTLISMNYYHLHTQNPDLYFSFLGAKDKKKVDFQAIAFNPKKNRFSVPLVSDSELMQHLKSIPRHTHGAKFQIMKKGFGISRDHFEKLNQNVSKKYDTSFIELVDQFKQKNIMYSYLPQNLLDYHDNIVINDNTERAQLKRDEQNPHLPNILLIVTPQMKEQFYLYGDVVGFDLTYSVIRERTKNNAEYSVGVFASTNLYKRIVIFGLVITNSQSVFAYSFIFKEFIRLIGKSPPVIITDEEKGMYYALKNIKKQGIFKGKHFFDMFHILKKFRKCSTLGSTFQNFRKMIHAKNRCEYRRIFQQAKRNIANTNELQLLRNFDLNSEKYCYSQVDQQFVGIGISNSPNEYFHHLIKNDIPYAARYIKAVRAMLNLIAYRNEWSLKLVPEKKFTKHLNLPWIEDLTSYVSDRVLSYILKEISLSPQFVIIKAENQTKQLLKGFGQDKVSQLQFKRDHYYVYNQGSVFKIVKEKTGKDQNKYKWRCICGLEYKVGYPCAHLAKILIEQKESFRNNINKRWLISEDATQKSRRLLELDGLKMRKHIEKKLYFGLDNNTK